MLVLILPTPQRDGGLSQPPARLSQEQVFNLGPVMGRSDVLPTELSQQRLQIKDASKQDDTLQTLCTTIHNGWPEHHLECAKASLPYWNFHEKTCSHR